MRVAKSIDELYEEVKDYDMVLCNDAPLATALNNRVSKPFVGEFAVTPRQIAADLGSEILKGPVLDDIDIVRIVSKETGYTLKFVHGEIQNIERMRRYTKDVEKRLGGRSRKVYGSYIKLNTKDRAMERFDGENNPIYKGKKVAVIGTDLFDELDKYVNPKFGTFEEISIFKRGKYEIPEIRELSNNREIAENVASLITLENCRDVAIVLDVGGKMAATMKSALYKRKIPFINKLVVRDLNHVRDFLEFISLSLSFDLLKIGQIREIVGNYGGYLNSKYDNYLAKGFDIDVKERTKPILDLMDNIGEYTFEEVCDKIVGNSKKGQVKLMLDEIGILKEKVSERTADDLLYAVNNINDLKHNEQIPVEEKEGVLLVDCVNSVYIDRPIVFYLGISNEWEKDISFLNEIDYRLKDDEVDRNVERFQVLLQQGKKRVYVVNSTKDGRASAPCSYFDHCSEDKVCEKFSDVCCNIVKGSWSDEMKNDIVIGRGSESSGEVTEPIFSNSSYNLFFSCPRAYMFSRLLGEPDKESTIVGNHIHQYAEFRLSYPEWAKKHDVEYYVEFIADRCLNLYSPDKRVIEKSVLRASIKNINWLIDEIGIAPTFENENVNRDRNCFFDESMKFSADQSEVDMTLPDKGYGGKIDVLGENCIYDYKTGSSKGAQDIVDRMSLNTVTRYNHDFQPLFYFLLTEMRGHKDIRDFRFFYTRANINDFTKGVEVERYVRDNIIGVHIVDSMEQYFSDFYADELFANPKFSDYAGCRDKLVSVITDYGIGNYSGLKDNAEVAKAIGLDSKSKKILNQISKDFDKIYKNIEKSRSFADASDRNIFVLRESFADFVGDVEHAKEKYKEYFNTDFPALPKMECENCSFFDVCTATALKGGEEDVGNE